MNKPPTISVEYIESGTFCGGEEAVSIARIKPGETCLVIKRRDFKQLRAERDALVRAATDLLDHYTAMINSGDCGNWDPEGEEPVIAMRRALAGRAGESQ